LSDIAVIKDPFNTNPFFFEMVSFFIWVEELLQLKMKKLNIQAKAIFFKAISV